MKPGKLPNDVLKSLILSKLYSKNSNILIGPAVGEDCSIVKFGGDVCVLTTDPVTAASKNAGKIGVTICCNDVASSGVEIIGILVTVLAPVSSAINDIENIMKEINQTCMDLNIAVLGGHTEVTDSVNKMILSITAVGRGSHFVKTGGALIGDDIVITGTAGIEGTAILAEDYHNFLLDKVDKNILNQARDFINDISVVKAGQAASALGVNAMHDATEGGVLGAIYEVAEASGTGVYIYQDKIPVKAETKEICSIFKINPMRLISSGCMVISCPDGNKLVCGLKKQGIDAAVVGKIIKNKRILNIEGIEYDLDPPAADELFKASISAK